MLTLSAANSFDQAPPLVDPGAAASYSRWIDENQFYLRDHGAQLFVTGVAPSVSANGAVLVNLSGKLTPLPEPGSIVLTGLAVAGFAVYRRRRRSA